MEQAIKFLEQANIAQLIAMALMFWFFYSRINLKFEKIENKIDLLDKRMSLVESRMCVMEMRINDIATNVTHLTWRHQAVREIKDAKEQ
jgi:hypothetical protein